MAYPSDLVVGNCYFRVWYYDNDLIIPSIETLLYLGPEQDENGVEIWLFQHLSSDESQVSELSEVPYAYTADNIHSIIEFDELFRNMAEVATFRPLSSPETVVFPIGVNETSLKDLNERIKEFSADSECLSMTATIKYRDDGFSLGRREGGGFEIGFFPHPYMDPKEDQNLLSLFSEIGVSPHVDYLSDRGRTRILEFGMPENRNEILALCVRVLTEIYSMDLRDDLKYSYIKEDDV